jgi:hypothetical protein
MDKEQSGYRYSAGMDSVAERTSQNRQKKSHGILDGMGMIPRQIKKGS